MSENRKRRNHNPYDEAKPLSKLLFFWIMPFFKMGYKKDLQIDDLYEVPKDYLSENLAEKANRYWDEELTVAKEKNRPPKLRRVLWKIYGSGILICTLATMVDEWSIRIISPLFLAKLVKSFSKSSTVSRNDQYLYAAVVCLVPFLHNFFYHLSVFAIQRAGFSARVALSSLMFRKATRLSNSSKKQAAVGQLVNLLSNDVSRFDYGLLVLPYLIVCPIQVCLLLYFLFQELGFSSLSGVCFIFFLIPAQYFNGKFAGRFRQNIAKQTDIRGRIMNEIIIAIRVIKMYAWEKPFSNLIEKVRRLEVQQLRKSAYLRSFWLALHSSATKLMPCFTVVMYILLGNELSADKVFFVVSISNLLIKNILYFFPYAVAGMGETHSACNRIEEFLLIDEKSQSLGFESTILSDRKHLPSVSMKNATARWSEDNLTLNNINFHAEGDQLVMVVGVVGSGKSSFLNMLISELLLSNGKCKINGKTSYSAQEPWIFSGNVQQNILFGTPFDEKRYERIISVCALKDDFSQLPYGDKSIVGERGITLSGGQKARVNLARALYREADIYLLDDPLSAVDSRVSRHIFDECIRDHLRGKLRILATHQLQYLYQADYIIVLNKGEILAQGRYNELVDQGIDFVSLMASDDDDSKVSKPTVLEDTETKSDYANVGKDDPQENKELATEGSVTGKTYWGYFRSGHSLAGFVSLAIIFLSAQVVSSATEYWLSFWTDGEENKKLLESTNITQSSTLDPKNDVLNQSEYKGENFYISVYIGLVVAVILLCVLRSFHYFNYSLEISIHLHNRMFSSLVRAPTLFFDENPSGRVMNRFTKDMGVIDELLPSAFYDALQIFIELLGIMTIVVWSNYYLSIPAVGIFIVLWILRSVYVRTSRDVKRLESITKSPVFNHLSSSIQGLTTIRAFGCQDRMIKQFDNYQDAHSSAWFLFISSARSFGMWIDNICGVFLAFVTFSFLTVVDDSRSGIVGLVITSVMTLTQNIQWGVRQSSEAENFMTCVERSLEYVNLEPEASLESQDDKKPPSDWPKGGEIELKNVSLAYDDNGDVLKNVSFEIKSKEKIGIVGRTGAGKSSIIAALFRMTEPRGQIFVDGVLINEIGLHDLRKNISIIPQDPVLFSGTVRYNLDPFEQFEDDELWKILEEVQLKSRIPSLDFNVSDAGSNFSVGERQLVCLARAILRRNKFIVMDEATANVDPRTDAFIQNTMRNKFSDCSIITIAHRLHSVMDCDRILVLDNGHLMEYDHPHLLLQNPSGILYSLVEHTGSSGSAKLRQLAHQGYLQSQNLR